MGREVKRVHMDFDWYEKTEGRRWFGYLLNSVPCIACDKTGRTLNGKICPVCEGEKTVWPAVEPPTGKGWQMWEDTTDGSPISPVFSTSEQLAQWLADNDSLAMGAHTLSKEQWLEFIEQDMRCIQR